MPGQSRTVCVCARAEPGPRTVRANAQLTKSSLGRMDIDRFSRRIHCPAAPPMFFLLV
jgi:hypothetical protein